MGLGRRCILVNSFGGICRSLIFAIIIFGRIFMVKKCKHCSCELTELNAAKSGRNGKHLRNECKPCRSKAVIKYQSQNGDKRRAYANAYARKIGRVKRHPCGICGIPVYRIGKQVFCSPKCHLWSYVKVEDNGCWIYQGGLNRRGYGKFGKTTAHRASYQIFKGQIEEGKYVCHTCDNPPCVNPDHLWLGTNSDNQQDSIKKGRHRWQKNKKLALVGAT